MKNSIVAALSVAALLSAAGSVAASAFTGYSETGVVFYDDLAVFDFDPPDQTGSGGLLFDLLGLTDISLSADLLTGFLTQFDNTLDYNTVLDGSLLATMLLADGDIADDMFSMLFELDTGSTPFAIATFTGDLDGFGFTDFYTDGVLFTEGRLTIVGATQDHTGVVPLPAGVVLLGTALAGFLALGQSSLRREQPMR